MPDPRTDPSKMVVASAEPGSPDQPIADIPIPVRAYLGPIILEIPARPAQVAVVVRMATQELLAAGIISSAPPAQSITNPQEPTNREREGV